MVSGGGIVDLSWTASTDDVGVTGYEVFRAEGNGDFALVASPTDVSFTDNTVTVGVTYRYYLKALDAAQNRSWRTGEKTVTVSGGVADSQRPSSPRGVTALSAGGVVDLSWTASTDNVGVTGYQVFRAETNGDFAQIATPTGTSYADSAVTAGLSYRYYLKAVDAAQNTSWRTGYKTVTVSGGVADSERPSVPRGLAAASGGGVVNLSWTASTDNVGVTGYQVYRAEGNGSFALIATAPGVSFTDSTATVGTTYRYYLKAVDAAQNTSWRTGHKTITVQ